TAGTALTCASRAFPRILGAMTTFIALLVSTAHSTSTPTAPMGSRAVKAKMPISSVGSDHRAPESGFTLIEVLVVLVILALAMAVVVPAIGKGVGGSLD